jgi:hypothetical protein
MTDIQTRITGLDEIAARFKDSPAIVRRESTITVVRLAKVGADAAKARVGKKTRNLANSLTPTGGRAAGGGVAASFGSSLPYAGWHNDGRGAIVAKNAKALRFEIGGRIIFRKSVGPAKGTKYMEAGAAAIRARMPAEVALLRRRIVAALT